MTDAVLTVVQAGPLVTVQDAGRPGLARFGVPASGPMDRAALRIANAALGNPPGAAALEVSAGGLTLGCTAGVVSFAVAGGGFQVMLGDQRLAPWTVATLHPGVRLSIRAGGWGSWAILGFAGRLRAAGWLGSVATHALSGFGGGAVRPGQTLMIEGARAEHARQGALPQPAAASAGCVARVVGGPQERFFSAASLAAFRTATFALTDASDRMGVRLDGPSLRPDAALDMPSEAVVRGAVQVAGDGVASLLFADHQTTGGYPKIGTVIAADLDRVAQLRAADTLRFRIVTPAQAVQAARAAEADLRALLRRIADPVASLEHRLADHNLIGGVVDAADPD